MNGNVISNGFILHLIDIAITGSILSEQPLPRSLIVLFRAVSQQSPEFYKSDKLRDNQDKAITTALCLKAEGIGVNYRNIGRVLGVNASTVLRWFDGVGAKELEKWINSNIQDVVKKIEIYRKEDPDDGQEIEPARLLPWDE